MASNYPPGVSGNEPQITGEWPIEGYVEEAHETLGKLTEQIEEVASALDDRGAFTPSINKAVEDAISALDTLKDRISDLAPDEPDPDALHDRDR